MSVHIFGIRHHGPGSARSLCRALETLQPDCILVEGPPDADELIPLAAHGDMQPPVALLIYVPDQPHQAAYYPFAVFSPEWQTLQYGFNYNVTVRFMDLPQSNAFAVMPQLFATEVETQDETDEQQEEGLEESVAVVELTRELLLRLDPLHWLAEAAGYEDSERWWEHMVEQRLDSTDLFEAILEAMTALREHVEATTNYSPTHTKYEVLREAHMRKTIRAAEREGFERIAVICGAWHAPALANMPPATEDNELLKGLPKVKTQATWVPWTHGRLARTSGYGAGIESPGWYHHLWTSPDNIAIGWMTHVARLLRQEQLDASTVQVIDAVRLSETLAALRSRPVPGLAEMNEATSTVLCFGSDLPLALIQRKLIVGEVLGGVPDETPMMPLQRDLQAEQKRLRLKVEAEVRTLDLDLRKPNDLDRSRLLHRLMLLGIPWGRTRQVHGKSGTFHEYWQIQWQPEFAIHVIEASVWGNTVRDAATAFADDTADHAPDLRTLTTLLDQVLLADLPNAATHVMKRLQEEAALASDVPRLMEALPPLARILRYGNVRKTDSEMVNQVVDGLIIRICIGLPGACASLDDEAARAMFRLAISVNAAIALLQNHEHLAIWHEALEKTIKRDGLHGLLAGRFSRILLDMGRLDKAEGARRMRLSLSKAAEPSQAAAWVEGFLRESGLILLHDDILWGVLDEWVTTLSGEVFTELLPLLRRTFSTFSTFERRQLGERARRDATAPTRTISTENFDVARAEAVLPLVMQLLGLGSKDEP
jgi:hypothetical protein